MNMKTLTETSTFRVLSLLLCFCFFIPAMNVSASSLQADKFKVSGIVKDATGEPVIGASVVEYVWPLPTAELDTNKKLVQHDLWK